MSGHSSPHSLYAILSPYQHHSDTLTQPAPNSPAHSHTAPHKGKRKLPHKVGEHPQQTRTVDEYPYCPTA